MEAAPPWEIESDHAWFEPTQRAAHRGVLLFLHDAVGEVAAQLAPLVEPLEQHGLRAVAPTRRGCWWTDRLAPDESGPSAEGHVRDETVPLLRQRWGAEAPIALLGVGAGGHGVLRLAYKRAREFPIAAAWRPTIDGHQLIDGRMPLPAGMPRKAVRSLAARYRDAEQCRQDSAVLHIHPLGWPRHQWFGCPPRDPWWEGCDRLRMKLTSLGVPHECEIDTPINANDPAVTDRVVAWLADRLAQEARRVP